MDITKQQLQQTLTTKRAFKQALLLAFIVTLLEFLIPPLWEFLQKIVTHNNI